VHSSPPGPIWPADSWDGLAGMAEVGDAEFRAGDVAASIAELQSLLLTTEGVEGFLQELAVLAAAVVAGDAHERLSCGITLMPNGRPLTVASSDLLAGQIDQLQYQAGQGPCLEAAERGEPVLVADLAREPASERWNGFGLRAVAHGIRSSLSLPLTTGATTVGALNLYAPVPDLFAPQQRRRAESFAQVASGAAAVAARMAEQAALTDNLRAALASRAIIDQAIGVIMTRRRCTPDQAFAILREASQNRNIKLRDVAALFVAEVSGEASEPPPFDES
jgi:GAF domain-containing protein